MGFEWRCVLNPYVRVHTQTYTDARAHTNARIHLLIYQRAIKADVYFLYRNEAMMSFKQMTYAIVFRDVICFLCHDSLRLVNYLTMRAYLLAQPTFHIFQLFLYIRSHVYKTNR